MKKTVILLYLAFLSATTFAQTAVQRAATFNLEKKVAIQGYDPVSYFMQKKAIKGKPAIISIHDGVIYHFSTPANKETFVNNPSQYEPQYGGWCAFAMGDYGEKVEINPETFKIIDGKLYLFYNAYFNNTLKSWNKDETNLKKKADGNWRKLVNN